MKESNVTVFRLGLMAVVILITFGSCVIAGTITSNEGSHQVSSLLSGYGASSGTHASSTVGGITQTSVSAFVDVQGKGDGSVYLAPGISASAEVTAKQGHAKAELKVEPGSFGNGQDISGTSGIIMTSADVSNGGSNNGFSRAFAEVAGVANSGSPNQYSRVSGTSNSFAEVMSKDTSANSQSYILAYTTQVDQHARSGMWAEAGLNDPKGSAYANAAGEANAYVEGQPGWALIVNGGVSASLATSSLQHGYI
jgi:hypothetical protein